MVDSMVNMLEITPALLRRCLHDHGVPWEFKLEQSRNVFRRELCGVTLMLLPRPYAASADGDTSVLTPRGTSWLGSAR